MTSSLYAEYMSSLTDLAKSGMLRKTGFELLEKMSVCTRSGIVEEKTLLVSEGICRVFFDTSGIPSPTAKYGLIFRSSDWKACPNECWPSLFLLSVVFFPLINMSWGFVSV
mmetsp:Transcript_37474/g.69056  ORF Transcript_37474/g.69056 Transcript_37474/m.69056 type:complete len:111 (-) Transcript_37474:43-375(-)